MTNVTWTEELKFDIPELDMQHKEFIALVKRAQVLAKKKNAQEESRDFIEELAAHARHHFDTEEKYFIQYKYPKADKHKIEHMKMLQRINLFEEGILFDRTKPQEVLEFLNDAYDDHLRVIDMEFRDFIIKQRKKKARGSNVIDSISAFFEDFFAP